ncbi:MAG: MFS transporter [Pseudomonadota bacterium]
MASRAGLLTAAYYAAIFTAIGAHLPFWPLWLAHWGLDEAEIGWFLGAALAVRIVANALLSAVADRYAVRRAMLAVTGVAAAMVFALHALAETKAMLFALTLLVTVTLSPMIPLGEALGLRAAAMHGFAYAHVRAAGSIAFLAANVAVGMAIGRLGPDAALYTLVVAIAASAVLGAVHPGGGAPPGAGGDSARWREGLALFRARRLVLFALAVALGQASHASYYTYSALDWAAEGLSTVRVGQLWAFGVLAETALMLGPGRAWVGRLGAVGAILVGAAAGLVRWAAMAAGAEGAVLWPLQALHALSFGLLHLGTMAFVAAALPLRLQASGQGVLLGLASGVAMALATLGAGEAYALAGAEGAWLWAAALSACALAAAATLALQRPKAPEPRSTEGA